MKITITTEKRKEVEAIQKAFKKHLSDSVILRTTAAAINDTMKRAISNKQIGLNTAVRREFNITQKGLQKAITRHPQATSQSLWAGIGLRSNPIPLEKIYFPKIKQKRKKTKNGGIIPVGPVEVTIRKGKTENIRNAVLRDEKFTGRDYGRGVWSRGAYTPLGFEPGSTRKPYSGLRTASIYSMGLSKEVAKPLQSFMAGRVVNETRRLLQLQVDKLIDSCESTRYW